MIFPYSVDRPSRRIPYLTYTLIAVNALAFLLSIFVSNIYLPSDKGEGQRLIAAYLAAHPASVVSATAAAAPAATPAPTAAAGNAASDANTAAADADTAAAAAKGAADQAVTSKRDAEQASALADAFDNLAQPGGSRNMWQIQNAYSSIVIVPHYSVGDSFAYKVARPTPWGLFLSLFLHGNILSLLGDMLFLWVFGRAVEEAISARVLGGAYLLGGVVTVLAYHGLTLVMAPHSAALPFFAAPGAVAGVLGLFALRFNRAKVRLLYIVPQQLGILLVASCLGAFIGNYFLGTTAAIVLFVAIWAGFLGYARKSAWESMSAPSVWAIAAWLFVWNLAPALFLVSRQVKSGAVAYWAPLCGFVCGMLIGTLLGSKEEEAREYAIEDAQKAYGSGSIDAAVEQARSVLAAHPENAGAYEIIAKAHDDRGEQNEALDNYELAIKNYLLAGERAPAAALYLHSLKKNTGFILEPQTQLVVAGEMARNAQYKEAADNLAKIPFTFPDAAEGEISLLRAAQLYGEQLNELDMATYLLKTMLERYPETQWMAQVQRILKVTDYKTRTAAELAEAAEAPEAPTAPGAAKPAAPNQRPQAQAPPIKR